jgi:nucleotide-binding universal stress UspA family protein
MKAANIKRILVPTDFSETGSLAFDHAVFMARLFKAELHLVHVIEVIDATYSIYNPAIPVIDLSVIESDCKTRLEGMKADLKKKHSIASQVYVVHGRPEQAVMDLAESKNIDLVVMGTHGASGFDEFFIGSNAYRVVTTCPCPVITVQKHAKKLGFTDIVLPIDDSRHTRDKVGAVLGLGKKFGSRIHILALVDELSKEEKNKMETRLAPVKKAIEKAGLSWTEKLMKSDNVAKTSLNYAKKIKADLISIMTDHESKLTGMFIGPFAKQIVNHSRIPVLSVKPDEGSFEGVAYGEQNLYN